MTEADHDGTTNNRPPVSPLVPASRGDRLAAAAYDSHDLAGIPEPAALMADVLDRESVGMLAGKFGTYKTFLAIDWAASVATGRPWAGHPVTEASPVLYVAAEGRFGVRKRLAAWSATREPIPRGQFTVVTMPVRLMDREDAGWITERALQLGAGLIVVDTLRKCAPGRNENSTEDMGPVIDRVYELQAFTGATILLVHHTGYAGEHARGSSVSEDDIDSAFVIRLGSGKAEDRSPDTPRVLHQRKRKDGELLEPVRLQLQVIESAGSAVIDTDPFTPAEVQDAGRLDELELTADDLDLRGAGRPAIQRAFDAAGKRITQREAGALARRLRM